MNWKDKVQKLFPQGNEPLTRLIESWEGVSSSQVLSFLQTFPADPLRAKIMGRNAANGQLVYIDPHTGWIYSGEIRN